MVTVGYSGTPLAQYRKAMRADDVKVCAVDDVWSGLKLVIRKELRT